MVVKVSKPEINVREKISELDKPSGTSGEAMLRAETPQEQFNLIGAGRRNMLINGAMQHWQRGAGPQTVGSGGDYLPDRFKFWSSTGGAYTFERSTDTPNGFAYSTKLQVTTADTSLNSSEYSIFAQHLEVQDCLSARMGYSDAQELTLSFWVKSSKTGTYSMTIHKMEGTDYFCHRTFNINSADTWEHISLTYPPNTLSGISANGTGIGFRVVCWLAAGSTYYSSGTEGQWSTSANRYASDKNVNWMDSTSNDFYITGVQLELGKVATPFEHRSYGEELALCQRYYQKIDVPDQNGVLGATRTNTGSGINEYLGTEKLMVTMRSNPTVSGVGLDRLHMPGVTYSTLTQSPSFFVSNNTHFRHQSLPTTNNTSVIFAWIGSNSGGYIALDAEL